MATALTALGGASRQSLTSSRAALDRALKSSSATEVLKLATDLFAVVTTLDSSTLLRRSLTDSSRDVSSKSKLASDLFGKSISTAALTLLTELTSLRWSRPSDLADVLEQLAVEAEAFAANLVNELDRLEEELFSFARIVSSNDELRQALSSTKYSDDGKRSLISQLMGTKAATSTQRLLGNLVSGLRGRKIEGAISFYSAATSARKERAIAHVCSAVPLTEIQKEKLIKALSEKLGTGVRLNLEIDPTVLGGFSIRFADELIDATIVSRLADAGRALAV